VLQLLFAVPGIALIHTGQTWAIVLAFLVASGIAVVGMYGIESSFMVEMFGSRHRLSGVTVAKEIGGMTGAGIAPLIIAALLVAFGHWWVIAAYMILVTAIGTVAAFLAPEVRGRDLTLDHDAVPSGSDRHAADR
jgi:MHS family metabolite:H+ symporter-like MFS transporter